MRKHEKLTCSPIGKQAAVSTKQASGPAAGIAPAAPVAIASTPVQRGSCRVALMNTVGNITAGVHLAVATALMLKMVYQRYNCRSGEEVARDEGYTKAAALESPQVKFIEPDGVFSAEKI